MSEHKPYTAAQPEGAVLEAVNRDGKLHFVALDDFHVMLGDKFYTRPAEVTVEMRADLQAAIDYIREHNESFRECETVIDTGEWPDQEARAEYDTMAALVKRLEAALGGK